MQWHQAQLKEICARLQASEQGLSSEEATARLRLYGANEIVGAVRKNPLALFLGQFRDFMIMVLMAAAIVAGLLGEFADTVVIVAIVLLNAVIGFIQEYRAERAMEALQEMAAQQAVVIRDGAPAVIPAAQLVPGDVVLLEEGAIVPADVRLVEAVRLSVQEAVLTGESVPAQKDPATLPAHDLPLGDRHNLCYKGTVVTYGRGRALVVATGMETEFGRIAVMLGEEKAARTPLQRRLTMFGRRISVAILAVCFLIFLGGLLRGEDLFVMFLTAVSLAVAAIPEALPAVVTVSLALGAGKLARQNALVKNLPAVETLGSVTYICTDKTGTLTMNRMAVSQVYVDGEAMPADDLASRSGDDGVVRQILAAMALCNDIRIGSSGEISGDPTEVALFTLARDQGVDGRELAAHHARLADLPFDAERKLMTTVHSWNGTAVSFTKGAPEAVIARSVLQHTSAGSVELESGHLGEVAARMASEGFRVLGLAMRRWERIPDDPGSDEMETSLVFLGLVGIMDPPREEAREAVGTCAEAGIVPVMITGDHPQTALTIARMLGMVDREREVMTGTNLANLPFEVFEERISTIGVYARVAPEQKLKIVRALQEKGEVVAMTGDGVNDAPALKRADIGIAMGVTGTDVAKQSADLILLDDNFATIVKAVREGRRIYDNIRKFIKYLLTTNAGEIVVIAAAPFLGLPMPLVAVQILWINLMTDALPALALSLEPAEGDVMARPPRPPGESILAHGLGLHVVLVGFLIGVLVLGVQAWSLRQDDSHWQTMTFTVLCFTQLFHVLAIRSERESLFTLGLFSNKPLLGAVLVSLILQLVVVYVPALNPVFRTSPLEWSELLLAAAVSSIVFFAVELEKLVRRGNEGRARKSPPSVA